ncbi:SRPBCC family protein [uncultured Kordia sp.]|uniref:SRPBCC family protein n=1 Tax=uncultured Kordia sp. TaxID=507699 RepID=UPI002617FA27|nr:SRPBCC family protein [uncultured Kordia sp.]
MMIALYIVGGLLALIIFLALIAPKNFAVSRSIVVNRSLEDTFAFMKSIKNQDVWSPWKKKDPNMAQSYEGTDGEVGFVARWQGNKDVGEGEQEILKIVENEKVISKLRFFKPWKSEADAFLQTEGLSDTETRVTWGFSGKNKIPFNIFMLFMNMDKAVGKDFEEGLADLKAHLEK